MKTKSKLTTPFANVPISVWKVSGKPVTIDEFIEEGIGCVDATATTALRKRLRSARVTLATVLDGNVFEAGAVSRRRICRLNPAEGRAAGIGEDDVVAKFIEACSEGPRHAVVSGVSVNDAGNDGSLGFSAEPTV